MHAHVLSQSDSLVCKKTYASCLATELQDRTMVSLLGCQTDKSGRTATEGNLETPAALAVDTTTRSVQKKKLQVCVTHAAQSRLEEWPS